MTTKPAAATPSTPDFCFVLIDLTTSATPAAMRPRAAFPAFIEAIAGQVQGEFAAAWGAPSVAFRIASSPTDRATNEVAINFRDTLDVQGALAYHENINGVPDIEVGVDLFTTLLQGPESVASGVDHEVLETLGDPGANRWADRGTGEMDAVEMCDFVQNLTYDAPNGLTLSNFVLPSFFTPGASGPWDYLGAMTSQYDLGPSESNGYGIQAPSPTSSTQVGGRAAEKTPAQHRPRLGASPASPAWAVGTLTASARKRKGHVHARAYRRGLRF